MATRDLTDADVLALRRETPGADRVLHFNNAGASLLATPVIRAVKDYLDLEAVAGGYEAQAARGDAVEHTYAAIAQLIGAAPDEIAVVDSATRAWDAVFYALKFQPGDEILTSQTEYASNYLAFLQVARRTGAVVRAVASAPDGSVSLPALEAALSPRTRLVSLTHVPSNGGLVNPAHAVGALTRAAGVPFLLDACQSVGQLPTSVEELGCDFLSATGRKYLRAPRGTGFLYVRRSQLATLEPYSLDMHAATWRTPNTFEIRTDARRFETWEANIGTKIGLGVAVDYALALGLDAIWRRITVLADDLRSRLTKIPGAVVRDLGSVRCGIVSFTLAGLAPETVKAALTRHGINVSVTSAESTLLDMRTRGLDQVVRASLHYYNTSDEIDRFVATLGRLDT